MKKILLGLSITMLFASCVINVPEEKEPKVIRQNIEDVEKVEVDPSTIPPSDSENTPYRP